MAPTPNDCRKFNLIFTHNSLICLDLLPNITLFQVIESESRFARLIWSHKYLFKAAKFHYELEWWLKKGISFKVSEFP